MAMTCADFHVGDRVQTLDNGRYSITNHGWVGYVIGLDEESGYIIVGENKNTSIEYGYKVSPKYFIIIKKANEIEQKQEREVVKVENIITQEERESLLKAMKNLLDEYNYQYSPNALNKIIDEWATQKAPLIEAFKKHPNYMEGKFMIAFDTNFDRRIDKMASGDFSYWMEGGPMRTLKDEIPEEMKEKRDADGAAWLPNRLYWFMHDLSHIAERTISKETADLLNEICPAVHAHEGTKTTKVINKLCTYLGYNKHPDYNKEFAKYADSLNPLSIKRHTVLSLNPLDYLTMSFGNSWASCHTIDKRNKRGMPNSYEGQYSSGTMSYMLDPSSMVLYTVDSAYNGNEYWTPPKINRQMFHYGEEKLVQSRLYPQSCDCDDEAYTPYRNIVQEIISTIFEFPNLWSLTRGTSAASRYIDSDGTHYPDYRHFNACSLSRVKGSENEEWITVGAEPICIECGYRHSIEENINCCRDNCRVCYACGCEMDEDDAVYVNGEYYCQDCVDYCDHCQEYHVSESYYIEDGDIYVCQYCFDECYTTCACCNDRYNIDDTTWVESEDSYICEHCLEENYFHCDECGEYFSNDDMHNYDGRCLCDDCYDECVDEDEDEEEAC